jgi:hypothetical protein
LRRANAAALGFDTSPHCFVFMLQVKWIRVNEAPGTYFRLRALRMASVPVIVFSFSMVQKKPDCSGLQRTKKSPQI